MRKSIVIDGKDIRDEYGLFLSDEYSIVPPVPKENFLEVPGRSGVIDLSNIAGDVTYESRLQQFKLFIPYPKTFDDLTNRITNDLQGKHYSYQLTFDPDYIYNGQFTIIGCYQHANMGIIDLEILADPFKEKSPFLLYLNAAGGVELNLPCGRERQCPIWECDREIYLSVDGKGAYIPAGANRSFNHWLKQGDNGVFINSTPYASNMTYKELSEYTYVAISKKKAYQWYQNGKDTVLPFTYKQFSQLTYKQIAEKRMIEWWLPASDIKETNVYIKYDWRDL